MTGAPQEPADAGRRTLVTLLLLIVGAVLVLGHTALVVFRVGTVGQDTDIGGGVILLVGLGCLAGAAIQAVVAARRMGRPIVGFAVVAVCAAVAVVPSVTPSRGPGTVGVAAIAKAADGAPVAVIALCSKDIAQVILYGKERAEDHRAQAPIGIWTTDSADQAGIHEVPLSAAAGSDWQVTQAPPALIDGWYYSVAGASRDGEHGIAPAAFTLADVARLGDGEVLTAAGTQSRADFHARACDRYND